jgi:DNA-binding response OmpR family regulator
MTVRLVHDGYWVLPAATGREAWKLLRAPFSAIDLVVLDGQLADISSVQLCKLLRDRYPHLPVLVYAAPTQTADLTSFGQLGVRHYFRKPVDLERLLQTAEGILS